MRFALFHLLGASEHHVLTTGRLTGRGFTLIFTHTCGQKITDFTVPPVYAMNLKAIFGGGAKNLLGHVHASLRGLQSRHQPRHLLADLLRGQLANLHRGVVQHLAQLQSNKTHNMSFPGTQVFFLIEI